MEWKIKKRKQVRKDRKKVGMKWKLINSVDWVVLYIKKRKAERKKLKKKYTARKKEEQQKL